MSFDFCLTTAGAFLQSFLFLFCVVYFSAWWPILRRTVVRVVAVDDTACRTYADCLVLCDCPPISSHFEISSALRFIFPFSVNLRWVCRSVSYAWGMRKTLSNCSVLDLCMFVGDYVPICVFRLCGVLLWNWYTLRGMTFTVWCMGFI